MSACKRPEPRYRTLAELHDAFAEGLMPAGVKMLLDNDGASVHIPRDADWVNVETVFEMDPHDLLEQALDLLGIPYGYA